MTWLNGDPLEKCLVESLSMADLEFEHPSTFQEMFETILAIEVNEDAVVIEEENKAPNELVLKELPEIFDVHSSVKMA